MLYRALGSTGETVSAIGLGGYHVGMEHVDEALAIRLVRTAVDQGITFMDNCWDYNEGLSEVRMGRALRDGYRDRVFLMTKIDGRTKKEAAKQLDESLRRLDVDCVDLVQHHEVLRFEDPHRIFGEGGANEALVEAREAGKLRFIGFTGTRTPRSTCTRWRSPSSTGSPSTRCRCRSACSTPTTAASGSTSYRISSSAASACWA